jgi:hypothetical protein
MYNYKDPPLSTVSYDMGYNEEYPHNLNWDKLYNLGCNQGISTPSDFTGYSILNFGEPWQEGTIYSTKLFDRPYFSFISFAEIDSLSIAFLHGYLDCAPDSSRLILAIGTSNYGPNVSYEHGEALAQVINNIVNWIETPPSYEAKIGVVGAIDNELDWNEPSDSFNWRNGYIYNSSRFYLYFGDCAGCPTQKYFYWLPDNNWTIDDVYQMVRGPFSYPLPQIYRKDRIHAQQWQYLSLYVNDNNYNPLSFAGCITLWQACQEKGNCNNGTPNAIDNKPEEGWEQLYGELYNDRNTRQDDIPILTDISWNN